MEPDKRFDADFPERIARETNLREGTAGVVNVLRAIYQIKSPKMIDVARAALLPLPVASAVRRELEKAGVLERGKGLGFTDTGRKFVEQQLRFAPAADILCGACDGLTIAKPDPDMLRAFKALLADQPPTDVTLDQAPCTAETALNRVALMHRAGAFDGRHIMCLGDDDSVSLALCHYAKTKGIEMAFPVTVLELDPNRIDFIQRVAARECYAIDVHAHDLRDPIPASLRRQFDAVHTDPPYTLAGAELFLTRATEGLAPQGAGQLFFSYAQRAARDQAELMAMIGRLGLAAISVRPGFNHYIGADILGNQGQFMELLLYQQQTATPKPYGGAIYSQENSSRPRKYRCQKCRETVLLGKKRKFQTIEGLKKAGCPKCGADKFKRA